MSRVQAQLFQTLKLELWIRVGNFAEMADVMADEPGNQEHLSYEDCRSHNVQ